MIFVVGNNISFTFDVDDVSAPLNHILCQGSWTPQTIFGSKLRTGVQDSLRVLLWGKLH